MNYIFRMFLLRVADRFYYVVVAQMMNHEQTLFHAQQFFWAQMIKFPESLKLTAFSLSVLNTNFTVVT